MALEWPGRVEGNLTQQSDRLYPESDMFLSVSNCRASDSSNAARSTHEAPSGAKKPAGMQS
jgi:hypothetical protein